MVLPAHLFMRKPRLKQAARRRAAEILRNQRIDAKHGERFLRKQNFAARALLHAAEDFQISFQRRFAHQKAWRRQFVSFHIVPPVLFVVLPFVVSVFVRLILGAMPNRQIYAKPQVFCSIAYSTITGFSSTTQGNPY
jgi:hypothetical protein